MQLAQPLPIAATPEELLGFAYRCSITGTQCFFQFMRDDVVNNRRGCHLALFLTHHTEWMNTEVDKALSVPFAAVDAGFFIHASLQALRRSTRGAESG